MRQQPRLLAICAALLIALANVASLAQQPLDRVRRDGRSFCEAVGSGTCPER